MREKPIIALTMGDPTGIGPEIIVKALSCFELTSQFYPVLIGNQQSIKKVLTKFHQLSVELIWDIPVQAPGPGIIRILDPCGGDLSQLRPGHPDAESGEAALSYIQAAAELALEGKVDAVTTAPISKEAIRAAGCEFPGHTEFLAHLSDTSSYAMLLTGGRLRVALSSIHLALSDVPAGLNREHILEVIRLLDANLPRLGAKQKRIAVAALNPHGGEGGIFGREEGEIILPAIERAQEEGIEAGGPYPADSLFWRAANGEFDGVVAMYHDQGLIPIKLQAFHTGVNVTLGLPFIRTSPDHGCAFNLAGKDKANPSSMIEAIKLALRMALHDGGAREGAAT